MVAAFQLHFIAPAVDVIDRRGPGNEMHHPELKPKKAKVRFNHPPLLTRRSTSVLKVGVSYVWKMEKCITSYSQRRLR